MANQAVQKAHFLGLERAEWWFWLAWVLASAIGGGVGPVVGGVVGGAVGLLVGCAVGGALLGTAQWIVLRKRVHRSGRWVLASAIGWVAGGVVLGILIVIAGRPASTLVIIAVVGAAVGTAQWIVLRKRVHRFGWWVLSSVIGWAAGGTVVDAIVEAVIAQRRSWPGNWNETGVDMFQAAVEATIDTMVDSAVLGISVGVIVVGVVTGLVLILLLRHPIPEAPAPRQEAIDGQGSSDG